MRPLLAQIINMALRIVWLVAALAATAQAGWLSDLPNEPADKNRIVEVFQFPKTMLVSRASAPRWRPDPDAVFISCAALSPALTAVRSAAPIVPLSAPALTDELQPCRLEKVA